MRTSHPRSPLHPGVNPASGRAQKVGWFTAFLFQFQIQSDDTKCEKFLQEMWFGSVNSKEAILGDDGVKQMRVSTASSATQWIKEALYPFSSPKALHLARAGIVLMKTSHYRSSSLQFICLHTFCIQLS